MTIWKKYTIRQGILCIWSYEKNILPDKACFGYDYMKKNTTRQVILWIWLYEKTDNAYLGYDH